ncbi:MAG: CsbD family protein [Rhodocyclaceae bacterium]|nr:CsbD family protein [Rhodocyclaceae bacterium]
MNWDIVAGDWKQFQGKIQAQWGKLTNDQLDVIAGKRTELLGEIQKSYGVSVDEAEKQLKVFEARGDLNIKSHAAKKHA